ncbi:hypothetical protein ASPBRDRAFT_40239 [Aspergillus brasiliensis CBS 101740]|uniref:Uncharacterized protein n=1 Tax=Aspergillus brasiliensis (strain CBS 101740 / IMI 381727 / IBT 21946) TaxID=767769 RepID=A0A1L9UTC2_ASPBC|nr:hypothetical protein ASPBRDRAFT_40239 [Aspergillus brasiliensis CBS 101740]
MDHCIHRKKHEAPLEDTAVSSGSVCSSLLKISLYHVVCSTIPGPKAGKDGKGQSVAKVIWVGTHS